MALVAELDDGPALPRLVLQERPELVVGETHHTASRLLPDLPRPAVRPVSPLNHFLRGELGQDDHRESLAEPQRQPPVQLVDEVRKTFPHPRGDSADPSPVSALGEPRFLFEPARFPDQPVDDFGRVRAAPLRHPSSVGVVARRERPDARIDRYDFLLLLDVYGKTEIVEPGLRFPEQPAVVLEDEWERLAVLGPHHRGPVTDGAEKSRPDVTPRVLAVQLSRPDRERASVRFLLAQFELALQPLLFRPQRFARLDEVAERRVSYLVWHAPHGTAARLGVGDGASERLHPRVFLVRVYHLRRAVVDRVRRGEPQPERRSLPGVRMDPPFSTLRLRRASFFARFRLPPFLLGSFRLRFRFFFRGFVLLHGRALRFFADPRSVSRVSPARLSEPEPRRVARLARVDRSRLG